MTGTTTARRNSADLEQHREHMKLAADRERERTYDRARAKGIDHETAADMGHSAYAGYHARHGHPDDSMTKLMREQVAYARDMKSAVKLGLTGAAFWNHSADPTPAARAHRATAARTTVDHRRDTGTTTQASRRSDTGTRATGGRGDDDDADGDPPRLYKVIGTSSPAAIAAATRVLDREAARILAAKVAE